VVKPFYYAKLSEAKREYSEKHFDQAFTLFDDLSKQTLASYLFVGDIQSINAARDAAKKMSDATSIWRECKASSKRPIEKEKKAAQLIDEANKSYPFEVKHDEIE
jgi:hypothetical protein